MERGDNDPLFEQDCMKFVFQIQAEAQEVGMSAYFEIGVTVPPNGS